MYPFSDEDTNEEEVNEFVLSVGVSINHYMYMYFLTLAIDS